MASSADQSEESSSELQSGFSPLSPQFRYSLSRKQPRIKVSPPSSRSFPPPPPETQTLLAEGLCYKVPSKWCPDNRVLSRHLYLSRTSLLKKMIHQRILYRTLKPIFLKEADDAVSGMEILGSPIDYWVTMPIIHPPIALQIADLLPELKNVTLNEIQGISIAFAAGPVKPSRYALNRLSGYGREPDFDGLPFEWVRNATSTKFLRRSALISKGIEHIIGFVECPNCGSILCIGCVVPTRIDMVNVQWDPIRKKYGIVGRGSEFGCRCGGGEMIPGRPFVSDDLNKINWVFLFLGFGIGFCTVDQLRYYCYQRKLSMSDQKEKLFVTVMVDIFLQITERPPAGLIRA